MHSFVTPLNFRRFGTCHCKLSNLTMRLWYFPALIILLVQPLSAQRLEKFSEDQSEFMKQLLDFMTASKNAEQEKIYWDFDRVARGNVFSQQEFETILSVSNAMMALKMTANPFFSNYLKVLTIVKKDELGETRFRQYHNILDSLLGNIENRKVNPFNDFLEFSYAFLERNALRLGNGSVSWLANAPRYDWFYQDKQPVIRFEKATLCGLRGQDSLLIKNTSGSYKPISDTWTGKGGIVTWERYGMGQDVFAELGEYTINTRQSLYNASGVKMNYPLYFGGRTVEGIFSDKIASASESIDGNFPRFETSAEVLEVKNIGQGIKFFGGFRLQGTTVYGLGTKASPAILEISNKDKQLVLKAKSQLFTIRREERIVAESVEAFIYLGKDSIYHPSVNLRLEIPQMELQLSRGKRGSDRNPFYNSLQQVNIEAEKLEYLINKDSIIIGRTTLGLAKSPNPVIFESMHYYDEKDYRRLQNISTTNPIALLKVAFNETGERKLNANYLATKLNPKFTVDNIASLLYELVAKGFVNYDPETQIVELKDKIFHYADASQKKTDYDALRIASQTVQTNAVIDIKLNTATIAGVDAIEFSPTQKVAIQPTGNYIRLNRNRNINFDGKLFAGFSVFQGKDFHFEYDKFQLKLDSVRYLDFFVPTKDLDKNGKQQAFSIGSRLEHLRGILLIDAPANKAGREDIPVFPSFESQGPAYVFYDYPKVMGGAYIRDSFYFKLKPFSFKSLDKFGPADLNFHGQLYSSDIFPVINERLLLRPDSSLGFEASTPKEGYKMYQGKGTYLGSIDLSNRGLLGKGTVKYLSAQMDSEDLVFMPRQLTGTADRFDLAENKTGKVKVPQARGFMVSMDWLPYNDSMYILSKEAPFELFKANLHTLRGKLILTPDGLRANGLLDWDKASMTSGLFSFGVNSANADTADLNIKAISAKEMALSTSNLNARVDFDTQIGKFKANAEFLTTSLPYNQYQTSFNEFEWSMKDETVTFKSIPGKLGRFLSIHPDQDSLKFEGETAVYTLKTNLLKVGGVPYIIASDAFIYPPDGKVEIQPGAVISELKNAKIIADTVSKYHVINKATVNISGRKEYTASGFYEYNVGDKKQEIEFTSIIGTRVGPGARSEKKTITRATGEIHERKRFFIDHKTTFQGTISLSAEKPRLRFDGFAQLQSEKLPFKTWFSVGFEGDKNNLVINYDTPLSPEGEQMQCGLFLSKETANAYPSVMMPLYFRKDRPVLPVKGYLRYDLKADKFLFGDSLKVLGTLGALRGNLLTLDNKTGKMEMEGKLHLGSALKYVSVDGAGKIKTEFGETIVDSLMGTESMKSKLSLDAMLGFKLIIPEALMRILITDFKASTFDASPVAFAKDLDFYKKATSEIFPQSEEMSRTIDGISLGGLVLPKTVNPYTFLFDKVPMIWDADYQSFVSTNSKLGLMSINGEPLNTIINAHIEIKMPTNEDDRVYIYLKSPSQLYYFFGYRQGIMSIVSNNTRFMDQLNGMKEKELIVKMSDGEQYEIQVVNPTTANAFVSRIEAAKKQ
jgi:hypothetical protein